MFSPAFVPKESTGLKFVTPSLIAGLSVSGQTM